MPKAQHGAMLLQTTVNQHQTPNKTTLSAMIQPGKPGSLYPV